jgi:hypothetical protein
MEVMMLKSEGIKRAYIAAITILMLLLTAACSLSPEELAEEVQTAYLEDWEEAGLSIKVTKDLVLVKKSKTEYEGLMTLSFEGEIEQVTVDVVYDGETWKSEIRGW